MKHSLEVLDELIAMTDGAEEAQLKLYRKYYKNVIHLVDKYKADKDNYIPFLNELNYEINSFIEKNEKLVKKAIKMSYVLGYEKALKNEFVPHLDTILVEQAISKKWNPMLYSERVWRNKEALKDLIQNKFISTLTTGGSYDTLKREIRDEFGVSLAQATTLVRTESMNYYMDATIERYRQAGISKYKYISTEDARKCHHCAELNGKEYLITSAEKGINLPPLHPNCRCCIVPVVE